MALNTFLDRMDIISTISGGIFAGAASYISFAEVPALRQFGLNEQWRFFPHMYGRASKMQAPLTLISGTTGIIYSLRIAESSPNLSKLWLGAGLAFIAIIPHTMLFMMPLNNRIIESNQTLEAEAEKEDLLNVWSKLHLVRTIVSIAGFSVMVYGCIKCRS